MYQANKAKTQAKSPRNTPITIDLAMLKEATPEERERFTALIDRNLPKGQNFLDQAKYFINTKDGVRTETLEQPIIFTSSIVASPRSLDLGNLASLTQKKKDLLAALTYQQIQQKNRQFLPKGSYPVLINDQGEFKTVIVTISHALCWRYENELSGKKRYKIVGSETKSHLLTRLEDYSIDKKGQVHVRQLTPELAPQRLELANLNALNAEEKALLVALTKQRLKDNKKFLHTGIPYSVAIEKNGEKVIIPVILSHKIQRQSAGEDTSYSIVGKTEKVALTNPQKVELKEIELGSYSLALFNHVSINTFLKDLNLANLDNLNKDERELLAALTKQQMEARSRNYLCKGEIYEVTVQQHGKSIIVPVRISHDIYSRISKNSGDQVKEFHIAGAQEKVDAGANNLGIITIQQKYYELSGNDIAIKTSQYEKLIKLVSKFDRNHQDNTNKIKQEVKVSSVLDKEAQSHYEKDNKTSYFFMEKAKGKSQLAYVSEKNSHEPNFGDVLDDLKIMQGCIQELKKIHAQGYVHLDIKPEHIIIDANHQVKLVDRGTMRKTTSTGTSEGTLIYQSPERLGIAVDSEEPMNPAEKPDPAMDVYSLGVTFLKLLTKKNNLFVRPQAIEESLFRTICRLGSSDSAKFIVGEQKNIEKQLSHIPKDFREAIAANLASMLTTDPNERRKLELLESKLNKLVTDYQQYLKASNNDLQPPTDTSNKVNCEKLVKEFIKKLNRIIVIVESEFNPDEYKVSEKDFLAHKFYSTTLNKIKDILVSDKPADVKIKTAKSLAEAYDKDMAHNVYRFASNVGKFPKMREASQAEKFCDELKGLKINNISPLIPNPSETNDESQTSSLGTYSH